MKELFKQVLTDRSKRNKSSAKQAAEKAPTGASW